MLSYFLCVIKDMLLPISCEQMFSYFVISYIKRNYFVHHIVRVCLVVVDIRIVDCHMYPG
jgi:hypothetical protein